MRKVPRVQLFDAVAATPASTLEPLNVRRDTAAYMLGCGKSRIDELIARGLLDAKKDGKNLVITVASIRRYDASLPKAELKYQRHKP